MKYGKTTVKKVYQVTPGFDFKLEDLIKIDSGCPEGFYVEKYAPLELKPGKRYTIFKRDLCGRVKYFATTNTNVNLKTIVRLQAIVHTSFN